jgi:cyclophilin family peptidyl-prolyl cis-trans isomerase
MVKKVFLDISIAGDRTGTLVFELYQEEVPKTVENFIQLCEGVGSLTFKDNCFHRVIPGFMCQGGDITKGDGTGGMSIYGPRFEDETVKKKHLTGCLSMANRGPNTNGSQFFICFQDCPWLDGKHVVFGRLIDGDSLLKRIETFGTRSGVPMREIKITGAGLIN